VLPVTLSEEEVSELMKRAREVRDYRLTVDLERREVRDCHGFTAAFEVDEFRRRCLLEGLDDIGLTLRHDTLISQFEEHRPAWMGSDPTSMVSPERGL
jgi:3-isopropylmalate/(R)-2-methylmalate dehydratase small subunit